MPYTVQELQNRFTPIARAYGVQSVSLFGSYSRGYRKRIADNLERNHCDFAIDVPSVWNTLLYDIPSLKAACEQILNSD